MSRVGDPRTGSREPRPVVRNPIGGAAIAAIIAVGSAATIAGIAICLGLAWGYAQSALVLFTSLAVVAAGAR